MTAIGCRSMSAWPRAPVQEAARINGNAVLDAEVVCLDGGGMADFDIPHSRWTADPIAIGLAFDLLMFDGNDLRRQPLRDRKSALAKLLTHAEGHGQRMFEAVCKLLREL